MKQLIFCISIISLFSCKKIFDNTKEVNKIALPVYTETGANTFGFLYNNTIWTVFGKRYSNSGVASGYVPNYFEVSSILTGTNEWSIVAGGRLTIVKNDTAITDISAGFSFVPTIPFIKDYLLTNTYPGGFSMVDKVNNKYYQVNPARPLTLRLNKFDKIDSLLRICSGRFFGVLYNEIDANDSLLITDGRFDTKVFYK